MSKNVVLAEGVLAVVLLVVLQYLNTAASVRYPFVSRLVKSEPTLLAHHGNFLNAAMMAERVKREEVLAALRGHQLVAIEDAAAVILETDGSISVLARRSRECALTS